MKIAFVHSGVPNFNSSGIRSWQALAWLGSRHSVSLTPLIEFDDHRSSAQIELPGVRVDAPIIVPARNKWASRIQPTGSRSLKRSVESPLGERLVGVDWFWAGWWGLPLLEKTIQQARSKGTVVTWDWDSLALTCMRAARAHVPRNPAKALLRVENAAFYYAFERRQLGRLDLLSAPTDREVRWLGRATGRPCVRVRNFVDVSTFGTGRSEPPSDAGRIAVFVGSLTHAPNREGLLWFLERVWPAVIDAVPDARFQIVGRGSDAFLKGHRGTSGVELVGEVPDFQPYYARSRVAVVPIWWGGGVPFKVLDGAACARPLVTTPYIERVAGPGIQGARIAQTAKQFAEQTTSFLLDPESARREGLKALDWVTANYDQPVWNRDMVQLEQRLLSDIANRTN